MAKEIRIPLDDNDHIDFKTACIKNKETMREALLRMIRLYSIDDEVKIILKKALKSKEQMDNRIKKGQLT